MNEEIISILEKYFMETMEDMGHIYDEESKLYLITMEEELYAVLNNMFLDNMSHKNITIDNLNELTDEFYSRYNYEIQIYENSFLERESDFLTEKCMDLIEPKLEKNEFKKHSENMEEYLRNKFFDSFYNIYIPKFQLAKVEDVS